MTKIVTDEGKKLYLATVIGLYSRRILGYAMGAHHGAALVVAALSMAAVTCGGDVLGVIFHSDSERCSTNKITGTRSGRLPKLFYEAGRLVGRAGLTVRWCDRRSARWSLRWKAGT